MSNQIYELIPRVMADIGAVAKDRRNEQQKYAFRGIEDFYKAAQPALVKHGVFCVPEVIGHEVATHEKTNDQGRVTLWRHVTITVKHQFFCPDGSHVDVITMGEGLDNSDKATNKAMSGAMKYALIELFSVPTEDVEDADRTTPEAGRPANGGTVRRSFGKPQETLPSIQRREEPQPEPPAAATGDAQETIEQGQASNLHRSFRESLKKQLQPKADELLEGWLKKKGYIDADGKPTALRIPKAIFYEERDEAEKYARAI